MIRHFYYALLITFGCALTATAQEKPLSPVPTQAVYEYQLNYQLPWQRWYGGPGLSLGGTMPTKGVFGYASLNGLPFPGPLGSGVYVNGPAPHAVGMPVAPPFASGPMMTPGMPLPATGMPMMGGAPNPMSPAAYQSMGYPQMSPGGQPQRPQHNRLQTSTPGARRMSTEQQNMGDAKLRVQQWNQAYVKYRNAVDLAPDRAEPHFRLGVAFTALKQYASAIREFKRSLELDPTLPQSGDKLETIFGAGNKTMQSMILPSTVEWTREELTDTDRLFLLGLLLYFGDDPRGSEILESALRSGGPKDHILAFFNSNKGEPDADKPSLRSRGNPQPQDPENMLPLDDDAVPPSPTLFDAPSSPTGPPGPFPVPPPT